MNPTQSDYQLPPVDDASVPSASDATAPQVPAASAPVVTPFQPPVPAVADLIADESGLAAEDVDLIEKAWVEKAKAIVKSTEGDPYAQNKELNKIKADYIKKRYNRDIKVN